MTEKQYKVTGSWAPYGYMDYVEHDIELGDTIRVIYADGRESTYHEVVSMCQGLGFPFREVMVSPSYTCPDRRNDLLTGRGGLYRFERVEEIAPGERIEIHSPEDARPFEGRRVKLFWRCRGEDYPRGEGVLRVASKAIGVAASGPMVGMAGVDAVSWYLSDGVTAAIELLDSDPLDDARRRRDELAAELEKQTAELERLESEAAEKKAREAEAARFPLPEEWRWEKISLYGMCAIGPHPRGGEIPEMAVHLCRGKVVARGHDTRPYEKRELCAWCTWDSPPLDVVRAVIARYDAENAPYCVELNGA